MKVTLSLLFAVFLFHFAHAQISVSPISAESLKGAPFKFKGSRAMMADRVDDANSKNIFLFSKVGQGSNPDTLFFQKFSKTNEQWKLVQEKTISAPGAISIWQNRKAFFDADQDKQVEALFVYSLHDASMQKQLAVNLLLFYKNDSYTISETKDKITIYSANFQQLPASVKAYATEYWNGLDKWK
ncbi:hypothetical protein [Pedobacter sp. ASV12]|uniref:hypothetical protein n=1 Tax=Pedobacter sp. ASV12 TaxID=2795120 RepID=UPI0018EC2238|nr:hypothetical protein [Pedobacter sp. ASV12]